MRCRLPCRSTRLLGTRALARVLCVGLLLAVSGGRARADASKEYQLKAACVYNFVKFVEWPSGRFGDAASPILVGVWGDSPIFEPLQAVVQGRRVNGRPVEVRRIDTLDAAVGLHAVFVSGGLDTQDYVLRSVHRAGVVTLGETPVFAARGGLVTFRVEENKIRFDINIVAAERGRLRISSQVQKLARVTRRED